MYYFQEKVDKFNDLEEEVKQLNGKLKKEKGNVLWYSEENEKLKIKIMKLSQNIQSLESSKKEFEKTIHQLQDTNKELDAEVKRLEEKLKIYGDLFGKDSKLSSSLRRRSYQSDEERDEEIMFKNALAPLMEEIKEKDSQIRSLHEAMEEKNLHIESLTSEIDRLDQNIAAQITEKIRNMHLSGDSSGENDQSESETYSEKLICVNKRDRNSNEYDADESPTNSIPRKNSTVGQPGRISPELNINNENTYLDKNKENNNNNSTGDTSPDQELTVTTDVFYGMLRDHQENMEQNDLNYYRSINDVTQSPTPRIDISKHDEHRYSGADSPTETKFYITIENALLDNYNEDSRPSTSLPSLTNTPNNDVTNNETEEDISFKKMFVEDMCEQLAELECMVNIKYKSPQVSPKQTISTITTISPCNDANNTSESTVYPENVVDIETDESNSNDNTNVLYYFNADAGKTEAEETEGTPHQEKGLF